MVLGPQHYFGVDSTLGVYIGSWVVYGSGVYSAVVGVYIGSWGVYGSGVDSAVGVYIGSWGVYASGVDSALGYILVHRVYIGSSVGCI